MLKNSKIKKKIKKRLSFDQRIIIQLNQFESIQIRFDSDSIRFDSDSIQIRFDSIRKLIDRIRIEFESNLIKFGFDSNSV